MGNGQAVENPVEIGHLGGSTYAVDVSGQYAFISQGSDFVVLNITKKTAPMR